MVSKYLLVIFVFVLFFGAVKAQTFDSEKDIRKPVKIPAGILKLLGMTEPVRSCIQSGDLESSDKLTAAWFQAAKVNLNNDHFFDYLIKSNKGCLDGPRAANWWIFKGSSRGYTEVFADSVLSLSIKKTKTAGFYDIQTETTMMNIIRNQWKFDGRKYKLRRTEIIEVGD